MLILSRKPDLSGVLGSVDIFQPFWQWSQVSILLCCKPDIYDRISLSVSQNP